MMIVRGNLEGMGSDDNLDLLRCVMSRRPFDIKLTLEYACQLRLGYGHCRYSKGKHPCIACCQCFILCTRSSVGHTELRSSWFLWILAKSVPLIIIWPPDAGRTVGQRFALTCALCTMPMRVSSLVIRFCIVFPPTFCV
jgi:hypothetical protein